MEISATSQRSPLGRSNDVRGSVCNGFGLDGERKHQRVCRGKSGCGPAGAGRLSLETVLEPQNDRFSSEMLLRD